MTDPTDGLGDLFLVYLHLDSIAEGVIAGAHVSQGELIGAVGQEDATYPHLHLEFRKGEPSQQNSRHPLRYLPYINSANFTRLRLDRCNFSPNDDQRRTVRLRFAVLDRQEGDVQGVDVELRGRNGDGIVTRSVRVDFDDRSTIVSDKGDEHAFNDEGVAVEGYQKSNLKGEGLFDLTYGVIVRDITPEFELARLRVFDARSEHPACVEIGLPELPIGERPVHSRVEFEDATFPPAGWQQDVLPGNVCRSDPVAALDGEQGLLCKEVQGSHGSLIRAGLSFALPVARLPVRPMSWRLRADLRPAQLQMRTGSAIFPLAFLAGDRVVAAAVLREVRNDKLFGGVMIRAADGLVRERIDVTEGEIFRDAAIRWELELLRLGTRQTTVILRLDNNVIARVNGDTTGVDPDTACVGIAHEHSDVRATLHFDRLLLTETLR